MRIGIDFDNTIAAYDHVFRSLACEWNYLPKGFSGSKAQIRDLVRRQPDGETAWMRIQGKVYGALMYRAKPMPGVIDFIRSCRRHSVDVFIVSHKTEYGHFDSERINLRHVAIKWLSEHGFFDCDSAGLSPDNVFFETTRDEKIARISALGCTHFVDDLEEVFNETLFPDGVEKILLSVASRPLPEGPFSAFRDWHGISGSVIFPLIIAEKLVRSAITDIAAVGHGGNSRVYKVQTRNDVFALKAYPVLPGDNRDRMGAEFECLEFLHDNVTTSVPEPLAADKASGFALYSWIDGTAVDAPDDADVDAALAFISTLHGLRRAKGAHRLRPASEACLSGAEVLAQVYSRIARLRTVSAENTELASFIDISLAPAVEKVAKTARRQAELAGIDFDAELEPGYRTLSPSDFGFHNMLHRPDGRAAFLDFEYFGWDDPVKTVNDFILHPGMRLSDKLKRRFLTGARDIFSDNPEFAERLSLFYPLYVLRWCVILLNEFLPDHWARRVHAGASDRKTVCRKQLDKARHMLRYLTNICDDPCHAA